MRLKQETLPKVIFCLVPISGDPISSLKEKRLPSTRAVGWPQNRGLVDAVVGIAAQVEVHPVFYHGVGKRALGGSE